MFFQTDNEYVSRILREGSGSQCPQMLVPSTYFDKTEWIMTTTSAFDETKVAGLPWDLGQQVLQSKILSQTENKKVDINILKLWGQNHFVIYRLLTEWGHLFCFIFKFCSLPYSSGLVCRIQEPLNECWINKKQITKILSIAAPFLLH